MKNFNYLDYKNNIIKFFYVSAPIGRLYFFISFLIYLFFVGCCFAIASKLSFFIVPTILLALYIPFVMYIQRLWDMIGDKRISIGLGLACVLISYRYLFSIAIIIWILLLFVPHINDND